ncbi:hypothetical protein CYMTET_34624 [Cymbomonas tetramitiformis]|uniref:Uncharacterized protein n=1 Tax=Cymbomonas tetramitiformis TaxID=36881 RepID=A0AAE0FAY9_9CHLO|nr:hypothetical protein CYMTET_34624 [Cymbomonas tetramitiformis]
MCLDRVQPIAARVQRGAVKADRASSFWNDGSSCAFKFFGPVLRERLVDLWNAGLSVRLAHHQLNEQQTCTEEAARSAIQCLALGRSPEEALFYADWTGAGFL